MNTDYVSVMAPMALCGIGMSLYFAPLAHLVMGSVPAADRGIASGVSNAVREFGGVLGVAVLTAVLTANGGLPLP
ncbi:hypothetical protein [Streptomyces sp. NPDC048527]|uniref:hypothetical protein n=1 Tax=Streptomyces sp. NPDC048527 TaxID=3365568 RepID=UPI00371C6CAC